MIKVLVGTPINEYKLYSWDAYLEGVKNIEFENKETMIIDTGEERTFLSKAVNECYVYRTIPYEERALDRLNKARNKIIDYAIKHKYDYILFIDADVVVPPNVIKQLLSHKKKFVSGLYVGYQKCDPKSINAMARIYKDNEFQVLPKDYYDGRTHKVDITGIGCLLIHKDLFDIKFRCERNKKGKILKWEDLCYCQDIIQKHNIDLLLDTSVNCKHLLKGNHWEQYEAI